MLCRAGAKPSLRDVNDEDALTLSVVSGSVRIARVLLEIGFWKNGEEYFHSLTNAMCRVLTSPSFRARLLVCSFDPELTRLLPSPSVPKEIAWNDFCLSVSCTWIRMERVVGLAQRFTTRAYLCCWVTCHDARRNFVAVYKTLESAPTCNLFTFIYAPMPIYGFRVTVYTLNYAVLFLSHKQRMFGVSLSCVFALPHFFGTQLLQMWDPSYGCAGFIYTFYIFVSFIYWDCLFFNKQNC